MFLFKDLLKLIMFRKKDPEKIGLVTEGTTTYTVERYYFCPSFVLRKVF